MVGMNWMEINILKESLELKYVKWMIFNSNNQDLGDKKIQL